MPEKADVKFPAFMCPEEVDEILFTEDDLKKRVLVGCMIFAWQNAPIMIHPFAQYVALMVVECAMMNEMHEIQTKNFEREYLYVFTRYLSFFLFNFTCLPTIGMFERSIVEASGMTREEFPTFFTIFYDRHGEIVTLMFVVLILLQLCLWRKRNMKY